MFYGLVCGAVSCPGYEFKHGLSDIETLNQRTLRGDIEVTAISVHALAYLDNRYAVLPSGASMGGQDYGPRLVARERIDWSDGKPRTIAIPGALTSATLALRLWLAEQGIQAELAIYPFDQVGDVVRDKLVDAGVLIHEGQLTIEKNGLELLTDLGSWWWQRTNGLPLPLGVNVVRADLGADFARAVAKVMHDTVDYGLKHRREALHYAMSYGRGLDTAQADKFVGMYVNDLTIDMGERGRESILRFLREGRERGFIPAGPAPVFVG